MDLLALDETGALALIEVKNERTTRTVVGQSLEYLSKYDGISVEDLADECRDGKAEQLREEFRQTFGRELVGISPHRRVYIVAPSCDIHSAICLRYLSKCLEKSEIKYGFLVATKTGETFDLKAFDCPSMEHVRHLAGKFAVTPMGWLHFVMEGGNQAILWKIGRRRDDGTIRTTKGPAVNRRALTFSGRTLIPVAAVPEVDLSESGTAWAIPDQQGQWAKLIGTIRALDATRGEQEYVVFARFKEGTFRYFQIKHRQRFERMFRKTELALPDWRTIIEASQATRNQGGQGQLLGEERKPS